jgi:cyclic-di-GMP-binding biofilm dispersal mediator protein
MSLPVVGSRNLTDTLKAYCLLGNAGDLARVEAIQGEITMSDLKSKNILVLGASGVLGSTIATKLAGLGAQVMATSSNLESAEKVPGVCNPRLLVDLSNPESIRVLIEYLLDSDAKIDGIINATGVVAFGNYTELDSDVLQKLFSVNATGPIQLIQGLLPALKSSSTNGNDPFIVTISGVVAESPMAGLAAYSASKAALHSFTQAISRELRRDGIRVLDARPGHTETGLAGRAIGGTAPAFPTGMSAEHVVDRIVKAIVEDEKDLPSTAF